MGSVSLVAQRWLSNNVVAKLGIWIGAGQNTKFGPGFERAGPEAARKSAGRKMTTVGSFSGQESVIMPTAHKNASLTLLIVRGGPLLPTSGTPIAACR